MIPSIIAQHVEQWGKKGTSMILCFYRQEVKTFEEKHKIIDVPYSLLVFCSEANDFDSGKISTNASIDNN